MHYMPVTLLHSYALYTSNILHWKTLFSKTNKENSICIIKGNLLYEKINVSFETKNSA